MMRSVCRSWIVGIVWIALAGVGHADSSVQVHVADHPELADSSAAIQRATERLVTRRSLAAHGIRTVDVAVVRVATETIEQRVVVSADVRIALSGERGTMVAVIAGGARVETKLSSYPSREDQLRADAVGGAIEAALGRGPTRRLARAEPDERALARSFASAWTPGRWLRATAQR